MSFVFLSKLLPLFVYPLGLSCILLLVTLFLAWKKSPWMPIPVFLALIILFVSSNHYVSILLVRSLESRYIPSGELPSAEAIVILGGATKSALPPRPMVDVNEQGDRLFYGAKLYQEKKAPIIIVSGGRIDWFNNGGQAEAFDMAQLLTMMEVPDSAIIKEPDSLNTYENAINVGKILTEMEIKKVLLVTSALHMPRSLAIFKHQGIEAIPAPTDFLVSETEIIQPQGLLINLLPDAGDLAKTTKAIKEYIGMIVYRLRGWL